MSKKFVIAIDGPVGVGKGTLAIALAKKLNAVHIYTGGMYRALALACLEQNVDLHDEKKVLQLLQKSNIELEISPNGTRVFLNGEEVTSEIFTPKVSNVTPIIAAFASVRREMVLRQKKLIKGQSVVIEGRDIATDVSPNADFKVYLTAALSVRARRRFEQFARKDVDITYDDVVRETRERDRMDTRRKASPLTITPDSYILDTTDLTVEETVEKVMKKLEETNILND